MPDVAGRAAPKTRSSGAPEVDHDVVVVGAGFAGLIAGLELLRAGRRDFVVLERAAEVGGVWRDNVYPGCACDIRSHLYSIASHPDPNWRRSYARQPELLAYLRRVSEEAGLQRRIRLGAEVVEALWEEDAGRWRLTLAGGTVLRARSVLLASGPLNRSKIPAMPGLHRFSGEVMHSSAWRHEVTLAGRRVAVVGTGASAVQIVPSIAPEAGRLTVFQRSAAWVMPRGDRAVTGLERWLFRRVPGVQALVRHGLFWGLEAVGTAFLGKRRLQGPLRRVALGKLRREVRDPAVRAALTPDYPLGCKRMTVSDDYLPAFNRANVELVTSPVVEATASGLMTADGREHRLDVIVFATGFTVADPDDFLRVIGRDGRVLAEEWAVEGARAYLGVTLSGYPNLAMLLGPNSGLSYSSVVHVVESQMPYLLRWLAERDVAGPCAALDVRAEVQEAYNAELQAKLRGSIWNVGCSSWYLDRHGRNAVIYPDLSHRYRRRLARFDAGAYAVS